MRIAYRSALLGLLVCLAEASADEQNASSIPFRTNCTYAEYAELAFPMQHRADQILTLFIVIVGVVGNLISVIVWCHLYHGNSAAIYLISLSLNDIMVLLQCFHRCFYRLFDLLDSPRNYTNINCFIFMMIVPTCFQYSSNLYVFGFTFERWFSICFPFKTERICTIRRSICICLLIPLATLMSLVLSWPVSDVPQCKMGFFLEYIYEAFFMGILPVAVLIFNCLVIQAMLKVQRANKKLLKATGISPKKHYDVAANGTCQEEAYQINPAYDQPTQPGRRSRLFSTMLRNSPKKELKNANNNSTSFRSTTITLLVVSNYMIISCIIGGITYLMQYIVLDMEENFLVPPKTVCPNDQGEMGTKFLMAKLWLDKIALTHFMSGFFIYYITGTSFRNKFHEVFLRCKRRGLSGGSPIVSHSRSNQMHLNNNNNSSQPHQMLLLPSQEPSGAMSLLPNGEPRKKSSLPGTILPPTSRKRSMAAFLGQQTANQSGNSGHGQRKPSPLVLQQQIDEERNPPVTASGSNDRGDVWPTNSSLQRMDESSSSPLVAASQTNRPDDV